MQTTHEATTPALTSVGIDIGLQRKTCAECFRSEALAGH
jgi:hypothetical protein